MSQKDIEQIKDKLIDIDRFNSGVNKDLSALIREVQGINNFNKAVDFQFISLNTKIENKFSGLDRYIENRVYHQITRHLGIKWQSLIAFLTAFALCFAASTFFITGKVESFNKTVDQFNKTVDKKIESVTKDIKNLEAIINQPVVK